MNPYAFPGVAFNVFPICLSLNRPSKIWTFWICLVAIASFNVFGAPKWIKSWIGTSFLLFCCFYWGSIGLASFLNKVGLSTQGLVRIWRGHQFNHIIRHLLHSRVDIPKKFLHLLLNFARFVRYVPLLDIMLLFIFFKVLWELMEQSRIWNRQI